MDWRLLGIASSGAFVAALSTSLVAVSVPVIAHDLSAKPADVSWVLTAYLLAISAILALAGKAADVLGRKRVYLTGFVFFSAGSAMCASATVLPALIGARVMQGVGGAMLMAVGPALVTRAVAPERRARGLGIQLAATYFALTIGPGLGGVLSARVGWHAVFIVIAGAGIAGGLAALIALPNDTPDDARANAAHAFSSLDPGGAVLFGAGLTALLVGLKRAQDHGFTSAPAAAMMAFGAAALVVFTRHEAHHRTPLIPLGLFREPPFALGVVGAVLLYTVTFMLAYLLPVELQHGKGLDPATTGIYMTAQPATMAVVAPLSGVISDRWGPRLPSVAGMITIAAGLVGLAAGAEGATLAFALALVGAGAGLYVAPNSALIMSSAPKNRQGVAGAMAATARNLGMTVGIAIAASLHHALGFRVGVLVAAAVAVLNMLVAAVRPAGAATAT